MKPVEAEAAEASLWKRMIACSEHFPVPWRSESLFRLSSRDVAIKGHSTIYHESLAIRQRNGEKEVGEMGDGGGGIRGSISQSSSIIVL